LLIEGDRPHLVPRGIRRVHPQILLHPGNRKIGVLLHAIGGDPGRRHAAIDPPSTVPQTHHYCGHNDQRHPAPHTRFPQESLLTASFCTMHAFAPRKLTVWHPTQVVRSNPSFPRSFYIRFAKITLPLHIKLPFLPTWG